MHSDESQNNVPNPSLISQFWTALTENITAVWRRLTGQQAPILIPSTPLEVAPADFTLVDFTPADLTPFGLNLTTYAAAFTVLDRPDLNSREALFRDIEEHNRTEAALWNNILNSLNRDFFSYQPNIVRAAQHVWEEELRAWFAHNNPHPSTPVTGELVELEETQNARKLDEFGNLEINERFICGIMGEIMTHPIYDRNNPHQKMDYLNLLEWLKENNTHPFNRTELHISDLEYDEALKAEIDTFVSKTLDASAQAPSAPKS